MIGPFTAAALAGLAVVAVAVFAPAWLTRGINRGRRAARYGSVDLIRDAARAWRESRPAGAWERQTRRARDARRRALPAGTVAVHTPTSLDLGSAA